MLQPGTRCVVPGRVAFGGKTEPKSVPAGIRDWSPKQEPRPAGCLLKSLRKETLQLVKRNLVHLVIQVCVGCIRDNH